MQVDAAQERPRSAQQQGAAATVQANKAVSKEQPKTKFKRPGSVSAGATTTCAMQVDGAKRTAAAATPPSSSASVQPPANPFLGVDVAGVVGPFSRMIPNDPERGTLDVFGQRVTKSAGATGK
jgi:hypothetical protein